MMDVVSAIVNSHWLLALTPFAAAFSAIFLAVHLTSVFLAAARWQLAPATKSEHYRLVPVTILRPVCGLENFIEETLGSTFRLDHEHYEVIFCVARANDNAIPLIEQLIASHPDVTARVLIGDERISGNPKLNNLVKGWEQARHPWVVMADSNVLMPRDYVQRLLSQWRADTGVVCSPPFASRPEGTWAELECAFLNTYQARWQYFADTLGSGYAQGKSMLWRREDLERWGGIGALASEPAEDAAATKLVRSFGHRVRLVDQPFEQPLGERSLGAVWNRQLRWARLRRATFPVLYAFELISTAALPAVAAYAGGPAIGLSAFNAAGLFLLAVYGSEAALARACGARVTFRSVLLWIARDALFLGVWASGWVGRSFTWRGDESHALAAAGPALQKNSLQSARRI